MGEDPSNPTIDGFLRKVATTSPLAHPQPFLGTERYELVRRLGEGAFGLVFEAIDHAQGGRVALKLLRHTQPQALYRFKREFRGLADVIHPNLVRLYELQSDHREAFFTMELIEGKVLLEHLAGAPEKARPVLRQLAAGLDALHRAGKLHRDVKPSNVMIDAADRVVILDFGLTRDLAAGETTEVAGTPLYMSPEQCGDGPLAEASDWYAFGVILYELLVGRPPFAGGGLEVLARKQKEDPVPPSQLTAGVPADLEALCLALLKRSPAERPTGAEVLRRLEAVESPARPAAADGFVGREQERRLLAAAFDETRRGRRTVTLLHGSSGIGKSALLKQFLEETRACNPDAVILAGRCYQRESVPHKALDHVVDELALYLKRLPESEAAALLPRDTPALVQLFPVLRQVPRLSAPTAAAPNSRARGMAALRELFARLTDRHTVVVCVDDLQWGDADSADLLVELARSPDPPAFCFVGAFREEEAASSPFLERFGQLRHTVLGDLIAHELPLAGLDPAESKRLARRLLGEAGAARAEMVAAESRGVPFFLHELARHGENEPVELGRLVTSRVSRLDDPSQRLLEVVSLVGRPVEADLAGEISGAGAGLRDTLAGLRGQRLLRAREHKPSPLIETYHDRIREAVAAAIKPERRRRLHLAIAEALESRPSSDDAEIALHLRNGGEPGRALGHTLAAAEQAAASLAFAEAVRLRRIALDLLPLAENAPPRQELELALAEVLSAAGHGREAAQIFQRTAGDSDSRRALELRRRAAEELLNYGYLEEGYAVAREVLEAIGLSLPHGQAGMLARLALGRARVAMSGLRFRARDPATISEEDRLRVDTLSGIAYALWWMDPLTCVLLHNESLLLSLRIGDRERATGALCFETLVTGFGGWHARKQTAARLARVREVSGLGPESSAPLYAAEMAVAFLQGRWPEVRERAAEVERRFIQVAGTGALPPHPIQRHMAVLGLLSLFWMGRSGDLLRALPQLFRDFEERENFLGWAWSRLLESWALGFSGRVEAGRAAAADVRAKLPPVGFELHRWWLDFADVNFALTDGDAVLAWRLLGDRWPMLNRSFVSEQQRVIARWLRANCALALATTGDRSRLGQARRIARWLSREPAPWAVALGRSTAAAVAAADEDEEKTLRLLGEAELLLEGAHLESVLAAVRMARGRRVGGDSGRAICQRAETWMAHHYVVDAVNWAQLPIINKV